MNKTRGEIYIKIGKTTFINKFGQKIVISKLNPDLYELDTTILLNKSQIAISITTQSNKVDLWYLRLGYINPQRFK